MIGTRSPARAAACAVAVCLSACGGGGGSSGSPALPSRSSTPITQASAGPTAQATFRIDVSSGAASSSTARSIAARTPKYVSPATQSVSVALQGQSSPLAVANITPTSPGCTSSVAGTFCTINVVAPIGSDTFTVTAFAGTNGTGSVLSTATVVQTIALNATNSVPLVLNGVVSSASVILSSTSVPAGTPATVAVTVVAYDAAGEIIIGPGNYTSAVTLTDTDPTGNTALSTTSVTAPGTNATLTYNGGSMMGATVTPSVGGTPGTPVTFAPAGTAFTTYGLPASIYSASFGGQLPPVELLNGGPGGSVWVASTTNDGTVGLIASGGASTVFGNLPSAQITSLAPTSYGYESFGDQSGDIGAIAPDGFVTLASTFTDPCAQSTRVCGSADWMALGPDGNIWFSDPTGYIGLATSAGPVTEWDPTQLSGWPGGVSQPTQIAFGPDGNLYVADAAQDMVYKLVIGGEAPVSVVPLSSVGCTVTSVAVGSDGNVWFSDTCENLYAVPLATFTSGAVQNWSVASVTNEESFDALIATPGGIWTTDDQNAVYRISDTAAAGSPAQPAITTIVPFPSPDQIALGSDGNIWVAGNTGGGCEPPPAALAKIEYGVPQLGAQSVARNLPKAVHRAPSGATGRRPKGEC